MSSPSIIYQAEDANLNGPIVLRGRGSQGTGYVDYQSATGDTIEWTVDVSEAGSYSLFWRYALGSSNRPLKLSVNGDTVVSSLDFPRTGGWETWDFASQLVTFNAGSNTVVLEAIGSSGGNFDYLQVSEPSPVPPPIVTISDTSATEGTDDFLVFDVSLSSAAAEAITLDLSATDQTAQGGAIADFAVAPAGNPVDYANGEFEVSSDGGASWQAATNGTEVTFAQNQTDLKVRLAVNNDGVAESFETMTLGVAGVVSGLVAIGDSGIGTIQDNTATTAGSPISLLPFTDVRIEGDLFLNFDGTDGGMTDGNGDDIGFTMVDPSSNPGNPNPISGVVGYWPEKLDVANGVLQLTTTAGIQYLSVNNLDNALGVGLNLPSEAVTLETTLVDLPEPIGGYSQAGLWFGKADGGGSGTSEDDSIKIVVVSDQAGNYQVQALFEQNGQLIGQRTVDIVDDPASVSLSLLADPGNRTVTASYSVAGGPKQLVTTYNSVPQEWFSFDQAGINPEISTRSFGGIFATHRNASTSQVYKFDDFSIVASEPSNEPPPPTDEPQPPSPVGELAFDRWSIPIDRPTAMDMGPDGRLYVADLFGDIHALTIDPETRTFSNEVIETIPNSEGGRRLALGIQVDPDSTPDNVVLWVSHSDGAVFNGSLNSGKISRLSGDGFANKEDIVTGLPRAIANHATNSIDFAPDGKLYLWQGGNTGAGSANTAETEFADRPEQVLSAAALVVDIPKWKANPASFHGEVASPIGEFIDEFYDRKEQELGRPFTEVQVYASGLRNTYDGVWHSNGNIYAPDNGLGVTGTVPPVPRLGDPSDRNITTLFGDVNFDNPGPQPDPLNLIVEGGYYGFPNPYRDEVVFTDGSFQGFDSTNIPAGHPEYRKPLFNLGNNRSANGIIEYTADNFFGEMKGDLLISNYSGGDDLTRIQLSPDGLSVENSQSLIGNFTDPLPIAMGPQGSIFVGEFTGNRVTILEPLGLWRSDLPPVPNTILDAGSATLNSKLYMVGGKTSAGHVNSLYIYDPGDPIDPTDDVWQSGPDLPGAAVENPAVTTFDGKVYVFGGSTAAFSGAVDNVSIFDPVTSTWSTLSEEEDMPTPRGGATAQVLNGKIHVIGGMGSDGASLDTVEVYDPVTGEWSAGTSLQTPRDNPGSAVVDDSLYVFGGRTRNADGSVVNGTLDTLEIYDPITDAWSFGANMPTGRRTMSVGTLNGRIQAIGGEAPAATANEEYNPTTDSWRTLPDIPTARHGAAVATIDNVIYVAGGGPQTGSSFTDVVEAFSV